MGSPTCRPSRAPTLGSRCWPRHPREQGDATTRLSWLATSVVIVYAAFSWGALAVAEFVDLPGVESDLRSIGRGGIIEELRNHVVVAKFEDDDETPRSPQRARLGTLPTAVPGYRRESHG